MKKWYALLLACLLLLAGCSAAEETGEPDGFTFTYHGVQIAMHADAAPIIASLGEPKSCTEEASCAFDGLDKTYYYGSFYLTTYPMDGADYVYSLWFVDDTVSTEEGICIGSTQSEVDSAYGGDSFNGVNTYALIQGESKLTILLTDGLVSSIQYEARIG